MPIRHQVRLDLTGAAGPAVGHSVGPALPADAVLRSVETRDLQALAELMLDAYRGTIDDEGETLVEALDVVRDLLAGDAANQPLLQQSVVLQEGPAIDCACLVGLWSKPALPLVFYIVCRAARKNQGLAALVLRESIARLRREGHRELRAFITEGNRPSEALFARAGFDRVASPPKAPTQSG